MVLEEEDPQRKARNSIYLNPDILDGQNFDNIISEESEEGPEVDPDFVELFSIVEEDVDLWN